MIEVATNKVLLRAKALFMKYGIKSISMDDIAKDLGMSKKTLYELVDNKEELILRVVTDHIQEEEQSIELIRKSSIDAIDELVKIGRFTIQSLREVSPKTTYDLKKYYRSSWDTLEQLHNYYVLQVIRDNLTWGKEKGLYRDDVDSEIVARLYVNKLFIIVDEDVFPLKHFKREQLIKQHIIYHIQGVATREGSTLLMKYINQDDLQ